MEQGRARQQVRPPYTSTASAAARSAAASGRVPGQARAQRARDEQPPGVQSPGEQPRGEQARGRAHPQRAARCRRVPSVQRHSVRGQILDALRAALVDGELLPGEVYSAPVLGDRFGVSATPVREAMQQLALEGAVEVVPNRGFRVAERGAARAGRAGRGARPDRGPRDAAAGPHRARPRAGPTCARSPTRRSRPPRWATGRRYAESDRAFHRAVLALAGNQQLVTVADDLHRRAQWPLAAQPGHRAGPTSSPTPPNTPRCWTR